jgi:hypothetical protein
MSLGGGFEKPPMLDCRLHLLVPYSLNRSAADASIVNDTLRGGFS